VNKTMQCPSCNNTILQDSVICESCGIRLDWQEPARITTVVDTEAPTEVEDNFHVAPYVAPYVIPYQALAFHFLDSETPIIMESFSRVLIGRFEPDVVFPTVDLTPYQAQRLGVSRRHALITRVGETCVIMDLDSTNGTWLNEKRILPYEYHVLNSMDQLRFGNLKALVYFQRKTVNTNDEGSDTQLLLESTRGASLTLNYLSDMVLPYLKAISDLQGIYDELMGRKSIDVEIELLNHSRPIQTRLKGASDAINILQSVFRKLNSTESGHDQIQSFEKYDTLVLSSSQQAYLPRTDRSDRVLRTELRDIVHRQGGLSDTHDSDSMIRLTMIMLNEMAVGLSEADRIVYAARVLPIVRTILSSDLIPLFNDI
jgi:pSer/pThr/pTyr-binding forkhead associated (FHA) protein